MRVSLKSVRAPSTRSRGTRHSAVPDQLWASRSLRLAPFTPSMPSGRYMRYCVQKNLPFCRGYARLDITPSSHSQVKYVQSTISQTALQSFLFIISPSPSQEESSCHCGHANILNVLTSPPTPTQRRNLRLVSNGTHTLHCVRILIFFALLAGGVHRSHISH